MSDKNTPVLCLLDVLSHRGSIPVRGIVQHSSAEVLRYGARNAARRAWYFRCLIELSDFLAKDLPFKSNRSNAYYDLLYRARQFVNPEVPAKQLAIEANALPPFKAFAPRRRLCAACLGRGSIGPAHQLLRRCTAAGPRCPGTWPCPRDRGCPNAASSRRTESSPYSGRCRVAT